jgi:hypothetical protein
MLTLDLSDFMIELDEGTVKHVGTKTKAATVKLYHVTEMEAREFGDRVKLVFDDGEGNHVEVVLDSDQVESLLADAEALGGERSGGGSSGEGSTARAEADANDAPGGGDGPDRA